MELISINKLQSFWLHDEQHYSAEAGDAEKYSVLWTVLPNGHPFENNTFCYSWKVKDVIQRKVT